MLYRCGLRGLIELDLLFGVWARNNIDRLSAEDLDYLDHLSLQETPDLMKWFLKKEPVPEELHHPIMAEIQEYALNGTKEWAPAKGTGNQ